MGEPCSLMDGKKWTKGTSFNKEDAKEIKKGRQDYLQNIAYIIRVRYMKFNARS